MQDDVFTLELPFVGPLTRLRVRSDGAGASPDWLLDWVAVTVAAPQAGQQPKQQQQQRQQLEGENTEQPRGVETQEDWQQPRTWWFVARRWLDPATGLEAALDARDAPPDGDARHEGAHYTVTVRTSDIRRALAAPRAGLLRESARTLVGTGRAAGRR
jgi:hypothetical protein